MRINNKYLLGILVFVLVFSLGFVLGPQKASAVSAGDWNAGNIISDDQFYNSGAMTVAGIQSFLETKVPTCDTNGTQPASEYGRSDITHAQYAASRGWSGPPYVCLSDYYQVPRNDQVISNLSTNTIPGGAISAAQIIKNASDSYGISPNVLIATLQKESPGPLVTDTWPLASQYRNAMGYGCPDTAPCDPAYEGFYNQVTNAARQFKLYKDTPNNYRHKPFQNNSVLYNPNEDCGSSTVYIQNYATAGLYNYTPYQPNQAALNNLYGSGDSCSAYGNRNFWRIFNDWFDPKSFLYNSLKISANLSISNYTPAIGEDITTYFALTNVSDIQLNIPYIAMANWYNYPEQNNYDFGAVSTMTSFTPGETKEFKTFHRTLSNIGNYRTWVTLYYAGDWYNPLAQNGQVTTVNYSTHMPSLGITTVPIQLSPNNPIAGQSITASTVVRNYELNKYKNEPAPIKLDYVGIANWYDYPRNSSADYGFDVSVTLGNAPYPLSKTEILNIPSDNYRMWVAVCIGGKWYELPGSVKWYRVGMLDAAKTFVVTSPLVLSNTTPAIGEDITATFSIRNTSSVKVVLPFLAVANWYNYPAQNNRDIGSTQDYFNPGETKQFNLHRTLTEIGSYRAWITFYYGKSWNNPVSSVGATAITYRTHLPNIGITVVPVSFSPVNPTTGVSISATTIVRNYEPKPIRLNYLGIANWYDYPRTSSADYGFDKGITLAAFRDPSGLDSRSLSKSTTLTVKSDNYRVWVAMNIGTAWYELPGSVRWYSVK